MKKIIPFILLITLTTGLISSCNENNDVSNQSEYYSSNGLLSISESNSVASEVSTKAESTESSPIIKYPIDSVTPPEYPNIAIEVPALPLDIYTSPKCLMYKEPYYELVGDFFTFVLTKEQMNAYYKKLEEKGCSLVTSGTTMPPLYDLVKEYGITKQQFFYCKQKYIEAHGNNEFVYADDIIEALYKPTVEEIKKAAMNETAYYYGGNVYSYRDMCLMSPDKIKALAFTLTDADEYLNRDYKNEDLNNEYIKKKYENVKNNFFVKLTYGYDLYNMNAMYLLDKIDGKGLDLIRSLAQEKKWNRSIYYNTYKKQLEQFILPNQDVDREGKTITIFYPDDAPIVLKMYGIPREKLEKALNEYEKETGIQIYTKEDLDILYSWDFEKIEKHFAGPFNMVLEHIVYEGKTSDFDFFSLQDLLELNKIKNLDKIPFVKADLLDYYARAKDFFNSHGDYRFDDRLDYLVEYVKQKVK